MRREVIPGIVEIGQARRIGKTGTLETLRRIRLMPTHQSLEHIVPRGKDVSHIVKNGEAEALSEVGQTDRWKTQFLTIDEQRRAPNWKTGIRIAWSRLV